MQFYGGSHDLRLQRKSGKWLSLFGMVCIIDTLFFLDWSIRYWSFSRRMCLFTFSRVLPGSHNTPFSLQRGIHDINHELVFSSNPGFIFHDSPGLESGSQDEKKNIEAFIADRCGRPKMDERLHLIMWVIGEAQLFLPLMQVTLVYAFRSITIGHYLLAKWISCLWKLKEVRWEIPDHTHSS